jgi:hypothetical protein
MSTTSHTTPIETVKAGSGSKVHYRYENFPTTLCGQGLGTRGGRTSRLYKIDADANCSKCLEGATR